MFKYIYDINNLLSKRFSYLTVSASWFLTVDNWCTDSFGKDNYLIKFNPVNYKWCFYTNNEEDYTALKIRFNIYEESVFS